MKKTIIVKVLCILLIFLGFLLAFSARWCVNTYGDVGFDAILFTILSSLDGVAGDLIISYMRSVVPPLLVLTTCISFVVVILRGKNRIVLRIRKKKLQLLPFRPAISVILSLAICVGLTVYAARSVAMDQWLINILDASEIFENEYVDPLEADISFPEEKRNIIHIYLESMEVTFFDKENGGTLDYNVIPELYNLALENVNFSHRTGVGGMSEASGATWTIAALVAQTAGIPLKIPIEGNSMDSSMAFLPGAYTLMDILNENGYYQSFMCGSDADFGGRRSYFEQHGVDQIYDLYTARTDLGLAEDYHDGWWGMEDFLLYEYAKQELEEISQQDEPFAFYMLTVDTHHIGGNLCEYCGDDYEENYENVYSCASKQLNEFINWIMEQDFYENTTIVITGDHLSMDEEYMSSNLDDGYERMIYNCFINTSVEPTNSENRIFTQLDMFPTILAAIGCEISGERLGLGTNLFSDISTLPEEYGLEQFNDELSRTSNYYNNYLLTSSD